MKVKENINNIHDKSYKDIFSNREEFYEFLRDFVDGNIAKEINPDSLMLIDKSFVLPDYAELESDLIYNGKIGEDEVIIYVLLEFQSSVDYRMAIRLFFYMAEIWRDVIKNTPKLEYEKKEFKLPAILPVVIYNGKEKWTATKTLGEQINKKELLKDYVIDFRYPIIEVNNFRKEALYETQTLVSAFFALDQNMDWAEFLTRLIEITQIYKDLSEEKKNILKHWLKVTVDTKEYKEIKETIEVLFEEEEVLKMTSNLTKILDKEFEEREIKGEIKAKEEDALNFLKLGVSEEIVAKGTGLSLKRVLELKGKLN
ncbi:MAG: Rpn family recombination-promoting nuclease/putative transposase [Bacillota bacterium]|nr:Rpn family recombination-promoting nuclease/putative transposase [Bacillota bacterium]